MEHQQAKDMFTSYYDGDLAQEDKASLEAHLDACQECQSEWQEFEKTMGEVSGLLKMPPPQNVAASVEKKIHHRSRGRFFGKAKNNNIQFALISFILVLLFMLAYLMLTAVNEIIVFDEESETINAKDTE